MFILKPPDSYTGPAPLQRIDPDGNLVESGPELEFETVEEIDDHVRSGLIGGRGIHEVMVFRENTIIPNSLVFVTCYRIGGLTGWGS